MGKTEFLLIASVSCASLCERLGYDAALALPKDKKACFCFDRVEKAQAPMPFSLRWMDPPPKEDVEETPSYRWSL